MIFHLLLVDAINRISVTHSNPRTFIYSAFPFFPGPFTNAMRKISRASVFSSVRLSSRLNFSPLFYFRSPVETCTSRNRKALSRRAEKKPTTTAATPMPWKKKSGGKNRPQDGRMGNAREKQSINLHSPQIASHLLDRFVRLTIVAHFRFAFPYVCVCVLPVKNLGYKKYTLGRGQVKSAIVARVKLERSKCPLAFIECQIELNLPVCARSNAIQLA